ncbi:lymphocyte cytosolic protein 2 isoform X2 [Ambystoma mexicanum]|uniref:lymphocyte cytosolic protein 2 isoform X2 n=1 Tax=Ambystoma mexicanum TaxID=8296 RepID=UPI0037E7A369
MDLRNVPSRTEVLSWNPDALADYFKKMNFKDCEKVVKRHNINGERFLSMSENDIQKFPMLRVPIISKLCQEIKKKQDRRNPFKGWTQPPKVPDEPEQTPEGDGSSSFDTDDEWDDDYESPDEYEPVKNDDPDYESPVSEHDDDYEPPPANNEQAPQTLIFPAQPHQGIADYIDRPTTGNSFHSAPIPPQRPTPTAAPATTANRVNPINHNLPFNNDGKRSFKPLRSSPPPVDREHKPILQRSVAQGVMNSPIQGKRTLPDKMLPRIPRPPVPNDRNAAASRMVVQSPRPPRQHDINPEKDENRGPSRPIIPPGVALGNSNTFPPRNPQRLPPKPSTLGNSSVRVESMQTSGSLPTHSIEGNIRRITSQAENLPTFPKRGMSAVPKHKETVLDEDWFTGDITRQDAEEALRRIDQDGTFLVRNSSRKTISHPYVLMVLFNDKVYNVQIRYDQRQNVYLLGSGGKEHFPSVSEMIDYFTRTPLLLIDGKDRDLRYQCMLNHSAGSA